MVNQLKLIPNLFTAIRLILVPIMWVFAFLDMPFYIGVGLIIAALSDSVDGILARWLKQESKFGAQFDSLADNLIRPSAMIWLFMLRPEIIRDYPLLLLVVIIIYGLSMLVGWVKFRRFGNLHLYLAKTAGIFQYLFVVHAMLTNSFNPTLFVIAAGMFILAATETLLLQLVSSEVNEHMGSILLYYTRKRTN